MKNQSDLIVTIVAVLCMLIGVGVCFGTKKEATTQAPPEKVVLTPLQLPTANVVMAPSLPGAGSGSAGPAGAPGGGIGRGGPMGFPGPGGGGPVAPSGPPTGSGSNPLSSKIPGQLPQLSSGT